MTGSEVRAAGGVVWRQGGTGIEVLVVHRPRYDDWSFAKGKCDPGEADADCALREVEEETGLRCSLGPELATARYVDHRGRPKVVRYWSMTVTEELGLEPSDEVDALAWLDVEAAAERLTYDHDLHLLGEFAALTGRRRPGRRSS